MPSQAVVKIDRARAPAHRNAVAAALNSFLTSLDPRGDTENSKILRLALACSSDPRFREFLERLYQQRYGRWSLAAIATSCDLTLGEFRQFWQKALVDRVVEIARLRSLGIVEDLADRAMSNEVECERCNGRGWVVEDRGLLAEELPGYLRHLPDGRPIRTCANCAGSGKIPKLDSAWAAKMVLEIAGHTRRRAVQVATYNFGRDVAGMGRVNVDID
jgi:hypothetical protein